VLPITSTQKPPPPPLKKCKIGLSYTDPNFTNQNVTIQRIRQLEKMLETSKITVNLDWFSVLFEHTENSIPTPANDKEPASYQISDILTLHYPGSGGNQHYKFIWHILINGEHLATILTHTRNEKFVRKYHCKVDFKNHLLYSTDLWHVYDLITGAFSLTYINISRLDIAIDGLNPLIDFLNLYASQRPENKVAEMKNRARFNAKVLDRRSMNFQNFLIGSPGARKTITIYNKSLDIVLKRKDYIQEYWKANGIIKYITPSEILAKTIKSLKEPPIYIDGIENIYRFEIRAKGAAIKEIKNFDISLLQTPEGLLSITRLLCNNFFDFVYLFDPTNISRECNQSINLIPFSRFNLAHLTKIELQERDDLYKTKLSINKNIKQLFSAKLDPENASVYEMILFDLAQFNLYKWFEKKYNTDWIKTYPALSPDPTHATRVHTLIESIITEHQPSEV